MTTNFKDKAIAENGQDTNIKVTTKDKANAENGQDTNIKVTTKDKAIAENGQDTNIKVTTIDKVKKWRANIRSYILSVECLKLAILYEHLF